MDLIFMWVGDEVQVQRSVYLQRKNLCTASHLYGKNQPNLYIAKFNTISYIFIIKIFHYNIISVQLSNQNRNKCIIFKKICIFFQYLILYDWFFKKITYILSLIKNLHINIFLIFRKNVVKVGPHFVVWYFGHNSLDDFM